MRQCGCALFDAVRVCRHLSPPSLWSADFESHAASLFDRSLAIDLGESEHALNAADRGNAVSLMHLAANYADLRAGLEQIPADVRAYDPGFVDALNTALNARAIGCSGSQPLPPVKATSSKRSRTSL